MKKQFLDVDGISEYLSISKSNLYRKVTENKIPFHKVGSRTLFDIDEINLWVRSDGTLRSEGNLKFNDIKTFLD